MISAAGSRLTPLHAALLAFGAVLLGHALQIHDGFYDPIALRWIFLATLFVLAGAGRLPGPRGSEPLVAGVLVAGLLSFLLALATMPIGMYLSDPEPARHPAFLAGLGGATVLTLLLAFDPSRARRAWFPGLLLTYAALGVWLIRASPRPHIDVMTVFRAALTALADLHSPYSITFRNIYDSEAFYAAGLVVDGRVQFGFPYPPLSLLMAMPVDAFGQDVRYSELGALLVGAGCIGYAVRSRIAPLAAAALLFTPRTFFVLEQGWTESLAICWAGVTVYAAMRESLRRGARHPGLGLTPIALGLLVAVKQHLVIALWLTRWLRGNGKDAPSTTRMLLAACATAAVVTLPFLLWDPAGMWRSVVTLQLREPFRLDSLSLLSHFARAGWQPSPPVLLAAPIGALAVGLALTWWRLPRTPAGFAFGLGTMFLLLFLCSKKAFCNYYFLVSALLMAGVACASAGFQPDADARGGPAAEDPPVGGPLTAGL
ncbi:MAG: hypothetical protein ABJC89_00815 [Acidobacteriota bacterium]